MEQGINLKPLPPSYNGKAWTNKLLHGLNSAELHRLLQTYGANAINVAVAVNAQRGIK